MSKYATDLGENIPWAIASTLGGFHVDDKTIRAAYDDIRGEVDDFNVKAPPNPLFVGHGFTDGRSPRSVEYMAHRSFKKVGGAALSNAGGIASQVTQVDVSGILLHANATGSTGAHMKMLRGIAMKYPRSSTVRKWVEICMVAKSAKAGIRGTKLVGAVIPSGALGMATNVIANLGFVGVQMNYGTVVNKVAMELHWRANVEMRLSRIGGGKITTKVNGPASAVMFEIFRRRGATRFFGQYDVANIISETGGWFALRDKLLLM